MAFSCVHLINKWEDKLRWLFSLFSYGKKLACINKKVCALKKVSIAWPSQNHWMHTVRTWQYQTPQLLTGSADTITVPVRHSNVWTEHPLQNSWHQSHCEAELLPANARINWCSGAPYHLFIGGHPEKKSGKLIISLGHAPLQAEYTAHLLGISSCSEKIPGPYHFVSPRLKL